MIDAVLTIHVQQRSRWPNWVRWVIRAVLGLLCVALLAACAPEPTPTPSPTPTATATPTSVPTPPAPTPTPAKPTPTFTPIPTATLTPTPTAAATPTLAGEPGPDRVVITLILEPDVQVLGPAAFSKHVSKPGDAVSFEFRVQNTQGFKPVTYTFRSTYPSGSGITVVLDDGVYERTVQPGLPDVLSGTIYTSPSTPWGTYLIEIVFPEVEPEPEGTVLPTATPTLDYEP